MCESLSSPETSIATTMSSVPPESVLHDPGLPSQTANEDPAKLAPCVNFPNSVLDQSGLRQVEEVLEMVTSYLECRLRSVEDDEEASFTSPSGVHAQHREQIRICLTRFRAANIPKVPLRDYLLRIHKHCPFTPIKLLAIVHYFTTLELMYCQIATVLQCRNVHRLVLTALVIASKVLDDLLIPQLRFSVVGGISLHHLHGLELAFFFLMNGKVWITEECLVNAASCLNGKVLPCSRPLILTDSRDMIRSEVGNRPARGPRSGQP